MHAEAVPHRGHHHTTCGKQNNRQHRRNLAEALGPVMDRAVLDLERKPCGAVEHQHGDRQQPSEQRERMEQADQRAFVERAQIAIEAEGNACQHIADRDAEHQRGHEPAHEQRPVPAAPPCRIGPLGAIFEADRPQDQRRQHKEHGQIEAREADRIDKRPGRKYRAAAENEPNLVALPGRADRVDHHAPLFIGLANERQQRCHAKIEPVGERKADEQHAHQEPPDDAQGFVVDRGNHGGIPYSAGSAA